MTDSSDDKGRKAAIAGIRAKFDALASRRSALLREQQEISDKIQKVEAAIGDCRIAARLFEHELPELGGSLPRYRPKVSIETPDQAEFPLAPEATVRELVLKFLEVAGPKGIKAAPLRTMVESALQRSIHDKTIGMTLYRLSEKDPPQARRKGFIWFAT